MAKFSLTAALVLILSFHSVAQKLIHPLRVEGTSSSLRPASAKSLSDTLRVLAIMVQFQTDTDTRTSGNGRFDTTTAQQFIIDAPPRDSAYFADHLKFAKNYFQKASKGKQNISATVLGTVLTLSKQMKEYAPINSNLPLGQMVEEAWTTADSAYASFPFQSYNLFVVFHAGSGKDIDLRGSIGYDPTPYDLPSLYFSPGGLKNVFGPSYPGVELKNHPGFAITNSIILPETENRVLPAVGGDFLYQLGINGLVVANIASHLGLPDLFDTKTGGTAIGRFGLMDGQAIFSFFGLFPPEPSAWEKIYLGWTSPITAVPTGADVRAPAVGLYQTGNDTIYKIPISAKEYFLVENRNRDARQDGEKLTLRWNGQEFRRSYLQDDPHFNAFNVDSIYGTVVDVDELDWSLPGAIDYSGGILIWHIDETIIEKNLATNTINADPNHRGIDLEEADGSQDIGQSYGLLDPGSGSEDGSPIDYWFAKNTSPVYKNEFSETTNPNSLSYSFARSHITLNQFSDPGPVMTFRANVGDATISLVKTIKRRNLKFDNNDAPLVADIDGDGNEELLYTAGDSIYALKSDLSPYFNNPAGLFAPYGGKYQPCFAIGLFESVPTSSSPRYIIGQSDTSIYVFTGADNNNDGIADVNRRIPNEWKISTPVFYSNQDNALYWGLAEKYGRSVDKTGGVNTFDVVGSGPVIGFSSFDDSQVFVAENSVREFGRGGYVWDLGNRKIIAASFARLDPAKSGTGGVGGVAVFDDGTFSVLDFGTREIVAHPLPHSSTSLAFADIDNDGQLEILLGAGDKLFAYNRNGVLVENFPVTTSDGGNVAGSPIVVKQSGSNSAAIIFGSSKGHLDAVNERGKMLSGFPLQTGGIVSSPVLFTDKLVVASTDSSIYIWKTGTLFDTSRISWGNFLADKSHSNFTDNRSTPIARSTELLPTSLAYNWPNPVYDKTTNIRYYLNKPAAVRIRIYNMAGELIDDFSGPGLANLDNEIQWDVSKVQSGVYFAQIKASAIGEEKSVIVKIAVVK